MPIYEYFCTGCGHEFEILQGIKESVLTNCPGCSQSTLQKKISAAAFHLKGTGWYETDFKNSGKPDDKKSGKSDGESTETKSDTAGKTDKKAADKTDAQPSEKSVAAKSGAESPAAAP